MEPETALDSAIADLTKKLAPQLLRLDSLKAARAALSPPDQAANSQASANAGSAETMPRAWAKSLEALSPQGSVFADWRAKYETVRGKPIADGSFAAQLSKMKSAGHIHKEGDLWRPSSSQTNNGSSAPEKKPDPLPSPSNQEGGDANGLTANNTP